MESPFLVQHANFLAKTASCAFVTCCCCGDGNGELDTVNKVAGFLYAFIFCQIALVCYSS